MALSVARLIEQIHETPTQLVLAVSGGGSRAIAELFEVPGASRTLLEAAVPYCEAATVQWLGGRPDQFCAPPTARSMALVAWNRARQYAAAEVPLAGVACTAGLATDRPKLGPHRAHVALHTVARTATWSLELEKGHRTRNAEERLVGRLILNAVAEACGVQGRLALSLRSGERVEFSQTIAPQPWQDLLVGKTAAVCEGGDQRPAAAILAGAFNPLHAGHRRMAELAQQILGVPVALEISILNVDKPPLDYATIADRLRQLPAEQAVWLTRAATFEEKARLFPGAAFIVGIDTLRRIAAPRYYAGDPQAGRVALEQIAARGCRFLVFGRLIDNAFLRLSDIELPDVLRDLCQEVPPEQFRADISSTALRRVGRAERAPPERG